MIEEERRRSRTRFIKVPPTFFVAQDRIEKIAGIQPETSRKWVALSNRQKGSDAAEVGLLPPSFPFASFAFCLLTDGNCRRASMFRSRCCGAERMVLPDQKRKKRERRGKRRGRSRAETLDESPVSFEILFSFGRCGGLERK